MVSDAPARGGGISYQGEPGVGPDLSPPFAAPDEATRWLFGLNRLGIRPGLRRIRGLLRDLGHPERELRILVVAGTNGKGSTTRILAQLLQDAGHRVGTYTSPHLLGVHERIALAGRCVAPDDFSAKVEAIRPLVEKHQASWFETLTALALQIAGEARVDYLCCETGLGGRLDATNALPALAILLTTVDLDHQHILGETRAQIAAEKLGLLKRGVPLFCGVDSELRSQVFQTAVKRGSPCFFLDELVRWDQEPVRAGALPHREWSLALRRGTWNGLPDPGTAPLRRNVALAVLALAELAAELDTALLPADLAGSLGNLFLPGRYHQVLNRPDWIFDTAHNAQALTAALAAFTEGPCRGRRFVLWGGVRGKELPAELGRCLQGCTAVVAAPISLPRSRTPEELRHLLAVWGLLPGGFGAGGRDGATVGLVRDNLAAAVALLAREAGPEDQVLVTGSCFTVAEVLWLLGIRDLEATRAARAAASVLADLKEPS